MRFETWVSRLRAANTRRQYRANVLRFSRHFGVEPEETLNWSVEEIEQRLDDFKYHLLSGGMSGRSVISVFTGIRRWFKDHKKRVEVDLRDMDTGRTYLDYIPSRQDVQHLLDDAKLHHMVAVALMAFSGLRPVDVVSLRYENIKASYELGDEVITIVLKQKKTRDWYFTFLGPQGTRYLREHLGRREELSDESYVLQEKGITASGLCKAISRLILRSKGRHPTGEGFRVFRPYGLRKYFRRTISKLGESVAEFLMGHREGLESMVATYSGLRDMDPHAIQELKKQYIELLPEIETEITDVTLKAQLEKKEKEKVELVDRLSGFAEELDEIKESIKLMRDREREG
jgi:integrase